MLVIFHRLHAKVLKLVWNSRTVVGGKLLRSHNNDCIFFRLSVLMVSGIPVPLIVPLRVRGNVLDDQKSKFDIDTSNPIELKCDYSKFTIYYSTNGATPDLPGGDLSKFTNKYDKPFHLPVGKYLVKAFAVNPQGQRSSINAKLFRVSQGLKKYQHRSQDDDFKFIKDLHKSELMTNNENWSPDMSKNCFYEKQIMIPDDLTTSRQNFIPRSLNQDPQVGAFCTACGFNEMRGSKFCSRCGKNLGSANNLTGRQLRREIDSTSCLKCYASVADNSSFCQDCGCQMPRVDPRNIVRSMSGWPNDCMSKFCSTCGHDNSALDLYCFKCGLDLDSSIPPASMIPFVKCTLCSKENEQKSTFCIACGSVLVVAPSMATGLNSFCNQQYSKSTFPQGKNWEPVSIPMAKITLRNSVATQTVGLHYPTGTETKRNEYHEKWTQREKYAQQKKPKGKTTQSESTGSGFWEANVEFLNTAVRSYVEKNAEARVKLSQMKLKDLQSFAIETGSRSTEFVLKFEVRNEKSDSDEKKSKKKNGKKQNKKRDKSPSSSRSSSKSSSSSSDEDEKASRKSSKSNKDSKTDRKISSKSRTEGSVKSERSRASSAQSLSKLLIAAVKNEEDPDFLKQYIVEGANVNLIDPESGDSLLGVAVKHGNAKVIPILVKLGAEVDQISGKGETPLHAAVNEVCMSCHMAP